jgi:hypothetical protein
MEDGTSGTRGRDILELNVFSWKTVRQGPVNVSVSLGLFRETWSGTWSEECIRLQIVAACSAGLTEL